MDRVVYLIDYLVKQMVNEPNVVTVEQAQDEGIYSVINIKVSSNDMGCIIGKGGNVANAIRTIAQAVAYANGEKKVKVNIDSI